MEIAYYIYILDYSCGSLFEIAVSKDNAKSYNTEEIIDNNGFKLSNIEYMRCDNKLDVINIPY